jgi:glucan phosphoethanolaminetransferase (alkaline phosphatase superfamily)
MDSSFVTIGSIALGIGLAAAAGFRIFVPLLVAGIAARLDIIPLNDAFAWLASTPALITLGTAAVFETLAYYIPGLDHLLDAIAGPAAVAAGVVASASVMTEIPPGVMWPLAIIAGGGAAGITKAGAALVRASSGVATAGLANPLVSTTETASATALSIFALLVPILGALAAILILVWAVRRIARFLSARRAPH